MKIVRLQDNIVFEIIPSEATPVEVWYGDDFAKQCIEAPDNVEQGWAYDGEHFYIPEPEPEPEPEPTTEERIIALETENHLLNQQITALTDQNDFQEELIVELANIVYA